MIPIVCIERKLSFLCLSFSSQEWRKEEGWLEKEDGKEERRKASENCWESGRSKA